MGLFKRKEEITFDPTKSFVPESNFQDFWPALIESISDGSQDAKLLEVVFENGEEYYVYIDNTNIKYAFDVQRPLHLNKHSIWFDTYPNSENFITTITGLNEDSIDTSSPLFVIDLIEDFPEVSALLHEIVYDYTIEVLTRADKGIKVKSITTDLLFANDILKKSITDADFLNLTVPEAKTVVGKYNKKLADSLAAIVSKDIPLSDVRLLPGASEDKNPDASKEQAIFAAADVKTSLSDLQKSDYVNGFIWAEVVQTIEDLVWAKHLQLETSSISDSDQLPDYEIEEDVEEDVEEDPIVEVPETDDGVIEPYNDNLATPIYDELVRSM